MELVDLNPFILDVEDFHMEPFRPGMIDGSAVMSIILPASQVDIFQARLLPSTHTIEFKSRLNHVGNSTLMFSACDSDNLCTEMQLILRSADVNDAPTLAPSSITLVTAEDVTTQLTFLARDIEDDACPLDEPNGRYCQTLNVSILSPPASGSASVAPYLVSNTWRLTYTPAVDFFGSDLLSVSACDRSGACAISTVQIDVTSVDDMPIVSLQHVVLAEDTNFSATLMDYVYDPEGLVNAGTIRIAEDALRGVATYDNETSVMTYVPLSNFFGNDSITFEICDTNDSCLNSTITFSVESRNDLPVLADINVTAVEDEAVTFQLRALITDVEDVQIPLDGIVFIELPTRGQVVYDTGTGDATYTPSPDETGTDRARYQACDSSGGCVTGQVLFEIAPVNDAPRLRPHFAQAMPYPVSEDEFSLVLGYALHEDVDDPTDQSQVLSIGGGSPSLRITIVTPALHGELRVYSAFGIVGYKPALDYVGMDRFVYQVCDKCARPRNTELGRVHDNPDAKCVRERARAGPADEPGCLNVEVTLLVANSNDPAVAADLAAVTAVGVPVTVYPMRFVTDTDDAQAANLTSIGLDPATFNLTLVSEVDADSVAMVEPPVGGAVTVLPGGALVYAPSTAGFSGYDSFTYQICDVHQACTLGRVYLQVAPAAPAIISLMGYGGCVEDTTSSSTEQPDPYDDECENKTDTDSKYGNGDHLVLTFDQPTTMPPYGQAGRIILAADLLTFLEPSEALTRGVQQAELGIYGLWRSPTELAIVIVDTGFPEPSPSRSILTFAVRSVPAGQFCGRFRDNEPLHTPVDAPWRFCLLNALGTSQHANASSPLMEGDWGQLLGTVTQVVLSSPLDTSSSYFGVGSEIEVYIEPPLSSQQLYEHCQKSPDQIFRLDILGTNVTISIDCFQLVRPSTTIEPLTTFEYNCLYSPGSLTAAELASCTQVSRRDVTSNVTVYPNASLFIVRILTLNTTRLDPSNLEEFFEAIKLAWDLSQLSDTVFNQTLLLTAEHYINYTGVHGSLPNASTSFFVRGKQVLTPLLSSVIAIGSGQGLQSLTLVFDRDTNVPSSVDFDRTLTRADLDSILVFSPPLGTQAINSYVGRWDTRRVLVINVHEPHPLLATFPDISFRLPVDFANASTGDECLGRQVCGKLENNWGICDSTQDSCRSYGIFYGANVTRFTANNASAGWNKLWLLLLLLLLALLLVVFCVHRYHKRKAQNKDVSRVLRAWRAKAKATWAPNDPERAPFADAGEVWSRPPAMVAMRTNPDPFMNMQDLVDGGNAAGAAGKSGPESLDAAAAAAAPDPFMPRASANIVPAEALLPPLRMPMPAPSPARPEAVSLPPLKGSSRLAAASMAPTRLPPLQPGMLSQMPPAQQQQQQQPDFGHNKVSPMGMPPMRAPPGMPLAMAPPASLRKFPAPMMPPATGESVPRFAVPRTTGMNDPFAAARRASMLPPGQTSPEGAAAAASGPSPPRPSLPAALASQQRADPFARPSLPTSNPFENPAFRRGQMPQRPNLPPPTGAAAERPAMATMTRPTALPPAINRFPPRTIREDESNI